jgi:hypothetical protein
MGSSKTGRACEVWQLARELDLGKPLALDFACQFLPGDFDDVRQFSAE